MKLSRLWQLALLLLCFITFHASSTENQQARAINPETLAVIANKADPESLKLAAVYVKKRGIPQQNLIVVDLAGIPTTLSLAQFEALKKEIDKQLSPKILAVVFAWTSPYRVECNSLTSAYTLGFQGELCKHSCEPSKQSPYFNTISQQPHKDFGMRLSMLLPTLPGDGSERLIERGIASDGSWPEGEAYFMITSDKARSSRKQFFLPSGEVKERRLKIYRYFSDSIRDRKNVMFYFTGLVHVPHLDTLEFLPGAVGDHLTSSGGDLLGQYQMSSLKWLEAGTTGSYGSVSEPCNHWQKFPNPAVMMLNYLRGETLIEAYWKSVAWPGQGIFIGEPLANPYRP